MVVFRWNKGRATETRRPLQSVNASQGRVAPSACGARPKRPAESPAARPEKVQRTAQNGSPAGTPPGNPTAECVPSTHPVPSNSGTEKPQRDMLDRRTSPPLPRAISARSSSQLTPHLLGQTDAGGGSAHSCIGHAEILIFFFKKKTRRRLS
eukprot:SAG31_NODE_1796_length_7245_cov_57.374195_8_plen_152_part_00